MPSRFQPPYSVASAADSAASADRTDAFSLASVSRMPPLAIVFGPRDVPLGENGCCASETRSRPSGPVYFVWAGTEVAHTVRSRRTNRMDGWLYCVPLLRAVDSLGGNHSNLASSVIWALSNLEMGQVSRASSACSAKTAGDTPGTFAREERCTFGTVMPASVFSSVTVAVVAIRSGGNPAVVSLPENAMEKQPACAAATSSSGLVPGSSANRWAHV